MKKLAIYVHGIGGNAGEAEHYRPLLSGFGYDVVGFDYRAQNPWEAREEFPPFLESEKSGFDSILLIANSIGAYFAMISLSALHIDRALFISPVADMEKLICDMMNRANVTEDELRARGEIPTEFGETLSWDYRCCLRAHPIKWSVPSRILYGEHDNLTSLEKISFFAQRIGAPLTVMKGGEHWFHTEEQMEFADRRLEESLR